MALACGYLLRAAGKWEGVHLSKALIRAVVACLARGLLLLHAGGDESVRAQGMRGGPRGLAGYWCQKTPPGVRALPCPAHAQSQEMPEGLLHCRRNSRSMAWCLHLFVPGN